MTAHCDDPNDGEWTWKVKAGDDAAIIFTFRDLYYDAARVWKAQVRRYAGLTDTPEAECGVAVAATFDGRQMVTLALTAAQTRAMGDTGMTRTGGEWDLQVTDGGMVTTIVGGKFLLDPDVTR